MKKLNKEKIFYVWLLMQPIIDLIVSFTVRNDDSNVITIGVLLRGLFVAILMVASLFNKKNKSKKKLICYYSIAIIYFAIYMLARIYDNGFSLNLILHEVKYIFKYFYYPFVLVSLYSLKEVINIDNMKLKKVLNINLLIISSSILIAYLTRTSFSSYGNGNGGIIGWFYSANEIGAIIILLYPLAFLIDNNRHVWFNTFIMALAIISAMFIGTKTAYFGVIITLVFYVVYSLTLGRQDKVKTKYKITYILISVLLIAFLNFNSTALNNIERTNKTYNNPKLVENKDKVIVENVIFSSRLKFLSIDYKIFSNGNKTNYILGIGFTGEDKGKFPFEKRAEMDFFDIFLRFGVFGFIIYMLPTFILIIRSLKIIIRDKCKNYNNVIPLYSLLIGFAISFVAGHVLSSPAVSIYLALDIFLMTNVIDNSKIVDGNKKKKITIMALHLGYGGVEKYISSLCKMLQKEYEIEIICTYKVSEKPAFDFNDKIKIVYLIDGKSNKDEFKLAVKNKQVFSIISEGFKALKILYLKRKLNIDAIKKINSNYIITTKFHSALVGKYAREGIIKIATEHNYHNNDKKYINKIIKSVRGFDYLVCVSQELADFYSKKVKNTKCVFIPNVIDDLPKKYSDLKQNNLICIGRFEKEKGLFDLIDVVNKVKKSIADIKLYLIGDGSLRKDLELKVKKCKLEDNIIFTGFLSKKEMEKYLIESKLYVMTSFTESFGLVLIEAMSYKIPCVAFDSANGAKNILSNNVGVLIKNRDIDKMSSEIVTLLKEQKKINKYSVVGYNYCQKYLKDSIKTEWMKILNG